MADWIDIKDADLAVGTEVLAKVNDDMVVMARYTGVDGEEFVDPVQGWPIEMISAVKVRDQRAAALN